MLPASPALAQQVILTNTRGLDFGRFVAAGGGTVAVSPAGLRSTSGAVIPLNSANAGQAAFSVSRNGSGGGGKAIAISLPANGSIRLSNGSASMAVDGFSASPASLVTIPAGGTTLSIGATLTVAPNQARGNYTGSFPLIVNYQ